MLMNRRYDGFGQYFGEEYQTWTVDDTTRTEYVTPEAEPTAPEAEPQTYVELRSDGYTGGGEPLPENANACPSGNYADCANKYAKDNGGDAKSYLKMFTDGYTTVKDLVGVVGGVAGVDSGNSLKPQAFLETTNIANCGVPLHRYLCKANESCGMCLYRQATTGTYRAAAGDPKTPTAGPGPTVALGSRWAGASRRYEGGVPASRGGAGAGGGSGGMLLAAAAAAFWFFKK